MLYSAIFIIICLFINITSFGQGGTRNKYFEADYALQLYDYETALKLFLQLHKSDPENAMYNYRVGQCYINLPDQKKMALPYLEKAINSISEDFKDGSYTETNAPVETYYLLAKAYHVNEKLDDAIYYYNKYLPYTKDNALITSINNQIKACEYAKILINNPVGIEIVKLDENINSDLSEIYPVISEDETFMLYLVKDKNRNIVYFTKKEGQEWSTPKNINSAIGSFGDAFPSSISTDKERVYFTLKNFFTSDIGYATYVNGRWAKINELKKPVNTKSWDSHAFESADGTELYFVSDRKGGIGMLDIYKSVKNSKGNWDKPVNLGNTINTALNEIMPILSPDGKELYFISEGHSSIGGYDVFLSVKTGQNTWSEPVNLGYPINTTDDNVYFRPINNGIFAYTSFPQPEDINNFDIYRIEIFSEKNPKKVLLKGNLAMENNFSYFGDCKVSIVDMVLSDTIDTIFPDIINGDFQYVLTAGNYRIVFSKKDYKQHTEELYVTYNYPEPFIEINPKFEELQEEIILADNTDEPEYELAAEEQPADILPESDYDTPLYIEDDNNIEPSITNKEPDIERTITEKPDDNYYSKKAGDIVYTIQIMALKNPVRPDYFKNVDDIMVQIGNDGFYRYVTGKYYDINDAKYKLNEISAINYQGAFVRKLDLSQYINENYYNSSHSPEKKQDNNSANCYTIQIMALYNPVAVSYFKNLNDIKISYGTDKIFRYTYKQFTIYDYARAEINKIQGMGYKEAFIRRISDISNY